MFIRILKSAGSILPRLQSLDPLNGESFCTADADAFQGLPINGESKFDSLQPGSDIIRYCSVNAAAAAHEALRLDNSAGI